MAGMLGLAAPLRPTKVPVPDLGAHRKSAMDAFAQHQTLLGDPKGYTARLGQQGYAQALADAAQRANVLDAAYKQAWLQLNGPAQPGNSA